MTVARSTLDIIGNTPVVQLRRLIGDDAATVLVKLEYFNPTGSYKDRMAKAIIEAAEARGDLTPGQTILEITGGSTGSSLAFVCAQKGYKVKLISSDAFADEKLRTMAAFGAEVILVPSDGGRVTPAFIERAVARAKEIEASEPVFRTDQFHNEDALTGYREIVTELLAQVDTPIDAFCGGIGTGGMLIGVSRAFRDLGHQVRIVGLEPASAPMLSEGHGGSHHIEGVAVVLAPPMLQLGDYDEIRTIEEDDARETARRLVREEGIFAGTSSGMNIAGAIQLAKELGPGHTVATVACDFGLKYLAGDLFQT
jgi:cysteine synthase